MERWGRNDHGALGDGTDLRGRVPVGVQGLESGVAAIAAGSEHTCALTTSGGMLCWGSNASGSLGTGTGTDSFTPVGVSGLSSRVTAIAAGSHSCAVTVSGDLLCWGDNAEGQVGDGTTTDRPLPLVVDGIGPVASIAAGGSNTCALTSEGQAMCWGENREGQVGDGHFENNPEPLPVVGFSAAAVSLLGSPAIGVLGALLGFAARRYLRAPRLVRGGR